MSNPSALYTEPNCSLPALALTKRSLWSTLLLALLLIAALLFLFSPLAMATPAQTTLSQTVRNSVLTSASGVTGTYGEALTVTLRFTVTAGTTLTGPITLTTRFAGVSIPNNQLGLRFLGYQGPITAAPGTDPLNLTDFVSSTSGTAPNVTTYLTWTFDGITNTTGITFVYEIPYQVRLVWDGTADAANLVALNGTQSTLTWSPGGTGNFKNALNNLTLTLTKSDLGPVNSSKTYRLSAGQPGETLVVYTVTLKNGVGTLPATNPSTAYDLAMTDSLDSRLVYSTAFPLPDNVVSTPGANTMLVWSPDNWTLAPNATWVAYITATVPPTAVNSIAYTNTVRPYYTTQPGLPADSASYTPTISVSFVDGFFGSKRAVPVTGVRIGDSLTYTVRYTVTPAIYLNSPIFTDTLPLGFHYRADSFAATGDMTLTSAAITATSGVSELLRWQIENVPAIAANRYFTFTYLADVDGLNAVNTAVYTTNLQSLQNAVNAVQASWSDEASVTRRFTLTAQTQVAQPYLNVIGVGSTGWVGPASEIDSQIVYTLSVRNGGTITAHEVLLSDLLPPGVIYNGNLVPPAGGLWIEPNIGDSGAITFCLKTIGPGATAQIFFNALVTNLARPGDALTNRLTLLDYSGQPGGLYDGNGNDDDFAGIYDRHYNNMVIPNVLPAPVAYTFTLKGLTAIKTDAPDPVQPGQMLTYSIHYSNTSALFTAANAVLVDTYDQWLTYSGSTSFPSVPAPLHDVNARTLTWNLGTLSPNSVSSRITATFQVKAPIPNAVRVLTNTIASDWASPAPAVSRIVTTVLVQPIPAISLDDKDISVQANQLMTYTMIYSNASAAIGATTGTFTITLDYAPYLTFITSTGRLPVVPNGTIFTDTLGPGISRTVFLRMQVGRPLPYNLTSFTSTATIYQSSADVSDSDNEETPVWLPRYNLVKVNSSPGNPPVSPGNLIGYKIFVTNTGEVTGTNIVISDVWDINAYNQSLGTNWTNQGTYAVYTTIATLPPLAGVALDPMLMNVTNSVPSNVQVIHNTVYLTSTETTQQSAGHDTPIVGLFIQMTHQPDPVYPGQVLTYTINYIAYSPAIVAPVVTDTLPPEVIYIQCIGAESCNHANGKVVWSWPSGLIEGNSGAITVVVQAPPTEWVTLTNTYASNSAGGASYREGPPDYTYVGRPHMSITKQASTAVTPPAPGDLILYTLTYTNSGSYKSTGTVVTDTAPVSTSYQANSCSPQPCGESGGFVTWNVGEVPITTTRVLTMLTRIDPNAIAQGNITRTIVNNNYWLTADRNIFNENTPPSVNVAVMRPALVASKSASSSWIALNGLLTYTVHYTNTGGGVLTQLYFNDALDIRTLPISASPNCSVGQTVLCTDTNLAPGQSRQFTITVQRGSLGHNEVFTNAVNYFASNLYETLPVTTTTPVEILASNTSAGADFSATPRSGLCPLPVAFSNLSSGSGITGYLWNFGDGGTSTIADPVHVYKSANTFTVSLTVNVGANSSIRVRPAYILTTACQFSVYLPLIRK